MIGWSQSSTDSVTRAVVPRRRLESLLSDVNAETFDLKVNHLRALKRTIRSFLSVTVSGVYSI